MRIPILTFGAIASIIAINSVFANTVVTSQTYVDNADALKQDKIPATGTNASTPGTTVVTYTGTAGTIGERELFDYDDWRDVDPIDHYDDLPTVGALMGFFEELSDYKQDKIPASGFQGIEGLNPIDTINYLQVGVKGTGLATRTPIDGLVGERKIFEMTDLANYHNSQLSANEQELQDISIPTVGAMMSAISAAAPTLPTGTAGNVVTYNAQGNIGGSVATANAPTYSNGTLTNGANIATISAVETKQNKMTCTRWIDNAAHTDANCLLWNMAN